MKQKLFITFSLFFSLNFYAQDFQKFYEQKVEENKDLKDSIKQINVYSKKSLETIKLKSDSLTAVIKGLNDKISTLNKELNSSDFKEKKSCIESNQQKDLMISKLIISFDSLKLLQNTNLTLIQKLENDKNQILREKQRLSESEQHVLGILNKKYNSDPELIIKYDIEGISKDLEICKINSLEHSELESKINNCLTIKKAELLLSKKYNELEIKDFISKIQLLPSNPTFSKLIKELSDYNSKNESIKSLIDALEEINKIKVKGTDRSLIEEKQKEIYTTIYFETESIDTSRYIYLAQIIKKIYRTKEDVDASVLGIKEQL
jgi:hypothetical protein